METTSHPIVAVIGSRGYSCLDAVRVAVDDLDPSATLLLGDTGAVAGQARAAASGRRVVRVKPTRAEAAPAPLWHLRHRKLVAEADALLIFVDRPREALWHAIAIFRHAGLPVTIYGQAGTPSAPPMCAADPRPDNRPFYIRPNCPYCGRPLVLEDELKGNHDDIWYDEWMCPRHLGSWMDWPRWQLAGLRQMMRSATAHAEGTSDGDEEWLTAAQFRAGIRTRARLEARLLAATESSDTKAERVAIEKLIDDDPDGFRGFERLAALDERAGDIPSAIHALEAALFRFLLGRLGNGDDFQRIRGGLRRLNDHHPSA